tara:strand:+ start:688 stop:1305 length:618 start_codon:yes stop_codon:yes gene_type:complete
MAETFTSNEATTEPGELNAEEQASLELGEQMEQEQNALLAGKYSSPEQLEEAYLALQKKLGGDEEQEYEGNDETDETDNSEETSGLSDEDVDALQEMVGGAEEYANILNWAGQNLSEAEIDMYDDVMDSGDPAACFFAIQALASRYGDENGVEGEMLVGGNPTNEYQGFRSQAELVEAMSDPRYENDPAYRADVIALLENSDIEF